MIKKLKKLDLISGPIIGGAAYSILMNFKPKIKDIDIDGHFPELLSDIETIEVKLNKENLKITDIDQKNEEIRALFDKDNNIEIEYIGGLNFGNFNDSVRIKNYDKIEINNLSVISPKSFIELLADRQRNSDEDFKKAINIIKKYKLNFLDHKWRKPINVITFYVEKKKKESNMSDKELTAYGNDLMNKYRKK